MLVLICAKDPGVPRIQPYRLAPKGQHPAPGPLLMGPKRAQMSSIAVYHLKHPLKTLCSEARKYLIATGML